MDNISKDICSDLEAKKRLLEAIETVSNVVGSTMGYRGRTVLIESEGGFPTPTKDGYDTLKSITFQDPVKNLANLSLREAAEKTAKEAGDATTATVVLAHAFIKNSLLLLESGTAPIDIKKGIEESCKIVLSYLTEKSIPITDKLIHDIANTSSNGDKEITDIVTEAFLQAGENGSVGHFRSNTDSTFLEFIEGHLLEGGYADERFVNVYKERTTVFDDNPLVVLSEINFKTGNQILPFVDFAAKNGRQLLIVSDMEFPVQDVLLMNKLNGNLKICVIKPPHFGQKRRDVLADLALICNTTCITTLSGEDFRDNFAEFLGGCSKVIVGSTDTIFNISENTPTEIIESKIIELKKNIEQTVNSHEIKYLRERIAKLSGKISIIKVGALVEAELQEKIARVDDAVCAVRSAKEEGVIAGGGSLLNSASRLEGLDIVTKKALQAPFERILSNAGKTWDSDILALKYPFGYDVKEFKSVDMIEEGIVDSSKAMRNALINAMSVSNMILMTDNVITINRNQDGI
ncbi:MAG TPA: chaperonin GroEL [Flavobacterium sp.]